MPELPEVETTRSGIEPHVIGPAIREVIVRRGDLRQPVSEQIAELEGLTFCAVRRRSKYLLLETSGPWTLMIHLGMSGGLRISLAAEDWKKHDHVAVTFADGKQLRFHDPRRFGLVLLVPTAGLFDHPLLARLGPEPFDGTFDAAWLQACCRERTSSIKARIMDASVVVGVGNIYASEALFRAGVLPQTPAGTLGKRRLQRLVTSIQEVLTEAIAAGGTTIRDFLNAEAEPGYFVQQLAVYGRKGEPCRKCGRPIHQAVVAQRATYWCASCQKR